MAIGNYSGHHLSHTHFILWAFMKIIFFVENNHAGGMDSFFANVINNWPHEEDDLCLICNKGHPGLPFIKKSVQRECEYIDHDIPLNIDIVDRLFGWLPFKLRRLLRPFVRVLLSYFQLKRLRTLFISSGGDKLLVVNGAYPGGETCRLANIAWDNLGRAKSVHNIRNFAIPPRLGFGWYENWIDRRLNNCVHSYIGVSKCCAESLRLRPTLKNSSKICHIYNGVPLPSIDETQTPSFKLRERLDIGSSPLCLMLGTYEQRKGHEFLFKAFAKTSVQHPDAHLVICGDSTYEEKAKVEKLRTLLAPSANIHMLDFVADGKKLINQADMLVVASQEWESFGWTVIEAMVRGVPVVSTNAGGLAEVVGPDGEAGFSVDRDDSNRFSDCMSELISNTQRRSAMGEKGRLRVSNMFTVGRMASEYSKILR